MIKNFINKFKKLIATIKQEAKKQIYTPCYRLVEILQDEEDNYTTAIQIINKNIIFYAKPEEILADDNLVDKFSPRDIRALTYLGYLGINSPKYKILAKRLVDSGKIIFVIKKKGAKNVITKTAEQILKEKDIIANMHPDDAKTIGYTVATEDLQQEKLQKINLLKSNTTQGQ